MGKISINNISYSILDAMNNITLADSFVLNKIGSGHGESKLYVGNESDELFDFFDDFDRKCFILKTDLLKFLETLQNEFENPQQQYKNPEAVHMNYHLSLNILNSGKEELLYFNIKRSKVKPPRVYINSRSSNYQLLRKIGLPNLSYLSILKLERGNEKLYYFKIFPDIEEKNIEIEEDKIKKDSKIDMTKKTTIINARKGQGKYREGVLEDCMYCPFTLVNDERLLIASHIKPWSKCNDDEKTDSKNGFALTPTFDKLFDCGFITFNDDKTLIVSPWLSPVNQKRLQIYTGKLISRLPLDSKRKIYLEYHRNNIFKG